MARTIRHRPTVQVSWIAAERDAHGNPVLNTNGVMNLLYQEDGSPVMETKELERGRRAGLSEHKSQTSYRRKLVNRRDRQAAKLQLRKGRFDEVETRQPRGRAISLAS